MCESSDFRVVIINTKRQLKGKLGHVVQIHVNLTLNLSDEYVSQSDCRIHGSMRVVERYWIRTGGD